MAGRRGTTNRYNRTYLPDFATDLKLQAAFDKVLELRSLSVGSRGQQNWLDALRSTGTLLGCLTEEEYHLLSLELKKHWTSPLNRGTLDQSKPDTDTMKGLF